jgi:hypothetical protein
MRSAALIGILLTSASLVVHGRHAAADAQARRADPVAGLEQLMMTGEPRHTDHDDGQLLQAAVNEAIRQGDAEIERLARRAAVPLLARVAVPVSPTTELPSLSIEMPEVLTVKNRPVPVAEVFAAVDGGGLVSIGRFTGSSGTAVNRALPAPAAQPGLHHIRLRARVTWPASAGLAPEMRDLKEIVYAIYDPADPARTGPRLFVENAMAVRADRLDGALPRVAFGAWLHDIVTRFTGSMAASGWRTAYCDERLIEAGLLPRTRDLCAVAMFGVNDERSGLAEVWIRTGRIEFTDTEVRWLGEAPTFEALQIGGASLESIAVLPELLVQPPETWPAGDVAVAPEEITVVRRSTTVDVTATIRNFGGADLHNAHVFLSTITEDAGGQREAGRRVLTIHVPHGGATAVSASLPMPAAYGAVLVHALQLTEHAPFGMWIPDPTPEDAVAFRVVNPRAAPRNYAEVLRGRCGPICRGY